AQLRNEQHRGGRGWERRSSKAKGYRARTTSFFVQACTLSQCAHVSLCVFTFLSAQSSSSTTWPVAVSLAVVGHRTRIRFVMVVESFVRPRAFNRVDIRSAPYRYRKGTFPASPGHRW